MELAFNLWTVGAVIGLCSICWGVFVMIQNNPQDTVFDKTAWLFMGLCFLTLSLIFGPSSHRVLLYVVRGLALVPVIVSALWLFCMLLLYGVHAIVRFFAKKSIRKHYYFDGETALVLSMVILFSGLLALLFFNIDVPAGDMTGKFILHTPSN